jgi:hypothetical protein
MSTVQIAERTTYKNLAENSAEEHIVENKGFD